MDIIKGGYMEVSAEEQVKQLLVSNLPSSDNKRIEQELKKNFPLSKHRAKRSLPRSNRTKPKKTLNRKEKEELGLFTIPRKSVKYSDMLKLNALWRGYMRQHLDLNNMKYGVPTVEDKSWESFSLLLLKADYHGAVITITRSRCPSYVGKSGICIIDTKNTFKIVEKNDVISTIPKMQCVFKIHLDDLEFTIFGKNFVVRPAERSVKKIKLRMEADL